MNKKNSDVVVAAVNNDADNDEDRDDKVTNNSNDNLDVERIASSLLTHDAFVADNYEREPLIATDIDVRPSLTTTALMPDANVTPFELVENDNDGDDEFEDARE